jgi:hypothetical protein
MRHLLLGLLLLPAACTGTIGDTTDDDDVPPPSSDVQIRIRDGNTPIAGVTVIFQASDESLIAELTTDATGTALAEMPEGGNLTIIRTYPLAIPPEVQLPAEVFTYVGVEPGDRLEAGRSTDELANPSAINVMVPEIAQGTISITTPCGSGQGTAPLIPITLRGCGASLPMYVTDGDGSSFAKLMPYSELVDVSSEPLLGKLSSTISATNVTLGTTVSVEKRLELSGFPLYSTGPKRVEATAATVDMPTLNNVDELLLTAITDGTNRTQMVSARKLYARGTTIVDGTVGLLPYLSDALYAPTGLSWVETGPALAQPDLVVATMTITRENALPSPTAVYIRAIVAPHTGGSLRMPVLPGAAAMFNPIATDEIAGAVGLAEITGDYAAARPTVFTASSILDTAPMDGRVVLTYAGNTPPGL